LSHLPLARGCSPLSASRSKDDRPRGLIGPFLGLFGHTKRGEEVTLGLLFVNIFLVMMAYYVLKTVKKGLVVSNSFFGIKGDEFEIYAYAIMSIILIGVIKVYGNLASRVGRLALIRTTMAAIIASLALFFALGSLGVSVALAYLIWLGVVNFLLVAQFWSFANDLYTESQGKRLFAIIAVGGSLGALIGPGLVARFNEHTYTLMLAAAVIFLVSTFLYGAVDRREKHLASEEDAAAAAAPLSKEGGFQLILKKRYLLLIAMVVLLANLVNTTGEYILNNGAREVATDAVPDSAGDHIADSEEREKFLAAERGSVINDFYGRFFSIVNLMALIIQALLVSRILKYLGVRVALFVLPVVALGGYMAIAFIGGVAVLRIAKTAENSTDYSLQNTVKHALFLPTGRAAKYKAKAAIDTFVVRAGDTLSGLLVLVGIHVIALGRYGFAAVNIGIILVWLMVCGLIVKHHSKLASEK